MGAKTKRAKGCVMVNGVIFQRFAGYFETDFWHSENVVLVVFTWILLGFSRLKV